MKKLYLGRLELFIPCSVIYFLYARSQVHAVDMTSVTDDSPPVEPKLKHAVLFGYGQSNSENPQTKQFVIMQHNSNHRWLYYHFSKIFLSNRKTVISFEYDFNHQNFKNKRPALLNLSLTGLSSAVAFDPTAPSTGLKYTHQPYSGTTGAVTA